MCPASGGGLRGASHPNAHLERRTHCLYIKESDTGNTGWVAK